MPRQAALGCTTMVPRIDAARTCPAPGAPRWPSAMRTSSRKILKLGLWSAWGRSKPPLLAHTEPLAEASSPSSPSCCTSLVHRRMGGRKPLARRVVHLFAASVCSSCSQGKWERRRWSQSSGHRALEEVLAEMASTSALDAARLRVVLFGATGMVGSGVLRECLLSPMVRRLGRGGHAGRGDSRGNRRCGGSQRDAHQQLAGHPKQTGPPSPGTPGGTPS